MAKKIVDDEQETNMLSSSSKNTIGTTSCGYDATKNIRRLQSEHPRITLNFQLIWLDPNIDESDDDFRNSIDQLQTIFHTINVFTDTDQCLDFLTDIQSEKVFMILSDNLGQCLIPFIHNFPQLVSIFIFHEEKSTDKEWTKNWSKVNGTFTQIVHLIESLKQGTRYRDQNSISISIVPPSIGLDQNLDQLDPTFMYTQLLKEILLKIEYNEQSIKNMAEHCRSHYVNIQATLKEIAQFEEQYYNKSAIWWYSAVTFVYTMLNRALRNLEVDTIIKMGVFIRDLHLHITNRHSDQLRTFTVYRGQGMSNTDFQKMKNNPGGLLSFNSFLSTSGDRDISFTFAESVIIDPNLIGVLFQMEIDQSIASTSFARINDLSQYESEDEILFSMNAIFRIGEIKPLDDNNRLWQVNLTITSDNDPQLNVLTDHMREETEHTTGWHRLVPLLIRLGEFEKAEELCKTLLQTTFLDAEKASIYAELGYIYDNLSNYKQAISSYKNALQIMQEILPPNDETLASTYNNIGLAYKNIGEHSNALSFLEKGLEIYKTTLPPDHPYFGIIYNNIGLVYDKLGKQSEALSCYEKSISFKNARPENHPEMATTYKNIGGIYKDMGEYSKALVFIEKSLEIEQKTLPPTHPSFAISYNHMGGIYKAMGDYSKAMSFYEKALEINKKNFTEDNYDVALCYSNIGALYEKMGEYSEALSSAQKSINIGQKILPSDHQLLATSYNILGLAYCHLNQHKEALLFCEKSLDIYQRTLNSDHLKLANSYNSVGGIYMCMGDYPKALSFYEKARAIQEKKLPSDHPDLANIYTNIGGLYFAMRDHAKAILFNEKGLEIRRKVLHQYHPDLIESYIGVAGPYVATGRLPEARSAYKNAVEIAQHSLPPNHRVRQACTMMYNLLHTSSTISNRSR